MGLSVIASLVEYFDIRSGAVELAFDNKSGEHKVEDVLDQIHVTNKCFDLIQDIKHRLDSLPIQVKFRWVKAHKKEAGLDLDWWEAANDQADSLAKEWRIKCVEKKREHLSPRLYYEKWAVYVNRTKISTISNDIIYEGISKSRIV